VKGRGVAVLAVIGAIIGAAIFAGCGSDSGTNAGGTSAGSSSATTDEASAPLSKAQFVKQAETICGDGLKKKDEAVTAALEELASEAQAPPSTQDMTKIVNESILPTYSEIVDQLGQLGAPEADEEKIQKMTGQFESALKHAEAEPAKAIKKSPFAAADQAARDYGIESCRL
jgi:hypothetical protein